MPHRQDEALSDSGHRLTAGFHRDSALVDVLVTPPLPVRADRQPTHCAGLFPDSLFLRRSSHPCRVQCNRSFRAVADHICRGVAVPGDRASDLGRAGTGVGLCADCDELAARALRSGPDEGCWTRRQHPARVGMGLRPNGRGLWPGAWVACTGATLFGRLHVRSWPWGLRQLAGRNGGWRGGGGWRAGELAGGECGVGLHAAGAVPCTSAVDPDRTAVSGHRRCGPRHRNRYRCGQCNQRHPSWDGVGRGRRVRR